MTPGDSPQPAKRVRRLAWMLWAGCLLGQNLQEARVAFQGKELVYLYEPREPSPKPPPLVVFLHDSAGGELEIARKFWRHWQAFTSPLGWSLVAPWTRTTLPAWTDGGVLALEAVVRDALKRLGADETRVYLAGQGDGASQVFFAVSRMPDLWAAALAIEGNPKIAIDTNRLFAANTSLAPVLWVHGGKLPSVEDAGRKLLAERYNVVTRQAADLTVEQALGWLSSRRRDPFPEKIDCETGNTAFARCYWLEVAKFDPSLRNDVLASTRVPPGAGAYLALGPFGFDPAATGPGVVVGWLPPDHSGALELNDRIVSVGGREIGNAQEYIAMMDEVKEEKATGVVIQRGTKRVRLETRIRLPERQEHLTARVQAEFLTDLRIVEVLSRGVSEMRLQMPQHWTPARINWNGAALGQADRAGCWLLTASEARPCDL